MLTQVQQRLPSGWQAALLAEDGSVTSSIPRQIERLRDSATHLVTRHDFSQCRTSVFVE